MLENIEIKVDKEIDHVQAWHNGKNVGQIIVPSIQFDWGLDTVIPMAGIGGVGTDEEYRRYGIAGKMMEKAVEYSKERGFCVGGVSTSHAIAARHLYTKHRYVYLYTIYGYEKAVEEKPPIQLPRQIQLRPFRQADAPAVIDLWNRSYSDKGFFGGIKQESYEWLEERKKLLLQDPRSIWVAVLDNTITGFAEYYYHWEDRVNCEILVEKSRYETGIIFGLLAKLENSMSRAGLQKMVFYPPPANLNLTGILRELGYDNIPAFVFQVALFDLPKAAELLGPLFEKRLKRSTLKKWPSTISINMEDQKAHISLPGGESAENIEISGSYETVVRILCGRKSAWEEYLRSHLHIDSRIKEDTKGVLDALFMQSPVFHSMRDRW